MSHEDALQAVYADRLKHKNGYAEIPVAFFVSHVDVGMEPPPPIAFYEKDGGSFKVLKESGKGFSPLALSVHESIWIKDTDYEALRGYAENTIIRAPKTPGKTGMPTEKRMEILRKSAINVVEDLFEHPTPENIQKSTKVVGSLVSLLMEDPNAFLMLGQLRSHDPYTLQHSMGVGINAIILAKKVGIRDEATLMEIGQAGLLHDIGKTKVSKEIINKKGPLNDEEWKKMRQHPVDGYEMVRNNPELTERTKKAILEHHENKDGTGYPAGKHANEIDLFSKIVTISDIYNALTTTRSYAKARSPFEAFQLMRKELMNKVDEHLFEELVLVYGGHVE